MTVARPTPTAGLTTHAVRVAHLKAINDALLAFMRAAVYEMIMEYRAATATESDVPLASWLSRRHISYVHLLDEMSGKLGGPERLLDDDLQYLVVRLQQLPEFQDLPRIRLSEFRDIEFVSSQDGIEG